MLDNISLLILLSGCALFIVFALWAKHNEVPDNKSGKMRSRHRHSH